ncbi:MAG: DUF3014 domain-containing protein [Cellvibrionaceae bacterium]
MSDNYYQEDTFQITPFLTIAGVIVLLGLMAWLWLSNSPTQEAKVLEIPQLEKTSPVEAKRIINDEEAVFESSDKDNLSETKNINEEKAGVNKTVEEPAIVLPVLKESDDPLKNSLGELSAGAALVKLLVPERIILKTVRAVLALAEGDVVKDFRPIKSPPPSFKVVKIDEPLDREIGQRYQINPKNYERYNSYINILSSLNKSDVAKIYKNYYPLLEESYLQYGVDKGSFDKVLNSVIDNIIASDVYEATVASDRILIQPKVFYVFQNKKIENLSGVDKLLLRIGEKNTQALKKELIDFKSAIHSFPEN